jgi:hypothetical protein
LKHGTIAGPTDNPLEFVGVYGFVQEIVGSEPDRFERLGAIDRSGKDNAVKVGVGFRKDP